MLAYATAVPSGAIARFGRETISIALSCGVADQNWLSPLVDEMRFLLISGDVTLVADEAARDIGISAAVTTKPKCVRCWQRRADVGTHEGHEEICGQSHR